MRGRTRCPSRGRSGRIDRECETRPTMPLRDHFRPPLDDRRSWDALHGAWPTVIVMDLNGRLPPRYVAEPRVHLGTSFEIDVAASDTEELTPAGAAAGMAGAATATALRGAAAPALGGATAPPGHGADPGAVYA